MSASRSSSRVGSSPCMTCCSTNTSAHALPVVQLAQGIDALLTKADAPRRLVGHVDLGNQVAGGRIPPREIDTGFLPDQAATAIASDEVLRPQRTAVGELDVDAGVVLGKARHLTCAIDRHCQLADPGGEDALDVVLPQREHVVVASRKVADAERVQREARDLRDLPFRRKRSATPR